MILDLIKEWTSAIIAVITPIIIGWVVSFVRARRKFEEDSRMDRQALNMKVDGLQGQFATITNDHKNLQESIVKLDRTLAELNITMLNFKDILSETREELRNKQTT